MVWMVGDVFVFDVAWSIRRALAGEERCLIDLLKLREVIGPDARPKFSAETPLI